MIQATKTLFPGVKFGEKHTLDDFGLIMLGGPEIAPPVVQSASVKIPGRDGLLSLTTVLDGNVHYYNRSWKCQFMAIDRSVFLSTCSSVLNYLHGQQLKCICDLEDGYYYTGEFSVDGIDYENGTITIVGDCSPYKVSVADGTKSL